MTGGRGVTARATARTRASAEQAYVLSGPLDPTDFYPRFGPLPAVVAVLDQSGDWDTIGRTRRLILSDSGHVIETITDTEVPGLFAYELSDFQRLFGMLVSGARAEWHFDSTINGARISWSYTFVAKRGRRWAVWLIVRLWWGRYMRRVLPPIAREIERLAAR
ncbi:SRPBCC family protein [Salinibacterium sp. SWN1162]|nr:SRPBCC family protein [Salinibacterium sp. SWN1162]